METEDRFLQVIDRLSYNPFYPSLKTHSVDIASLGKVYSSRVTGDIRIVWAFKEDLIIVLYRVGGHSGGSNVYK